jgi:hypothetical protein
MATCKCESANYGYQQATEPHYNTPSHRTPNVKNLSHAGPEDMDREAELGRSTRVGWRDLGDFGIIWVVISLQLRRS